MASVFSLMRVSLLALLLAGCGTVGTVGTLGTVGTQRGGPCDGQDPATAAAAWQGSGQYAGKDRYTNVVIDKGTLFYSLTPGITPGYAVKEATLRDAGGEWERYYQLVQVSTDPGKDANKVPRALRTQVQVFEAIAPLCAATGQALANPQFGQGGAVQYYFVPADAGRFRPGAVLPIARWKLAPEPAPEPR